MYPIRVTESYCSKSCESKPHHSYQCESKPVECTPCSYNPCGSSYNPGNCNPCNSYDLGEFQQLQRDYTKFDSIADENFSIAIKELCCAIEAMKMGIEMRRNSEMAKHCMNSWLCKNKGCYTTNCSECKCQELKITEAKLMQQLADLEAQALQLTELALATLNTSKQVDKELYEVECTMSKSCYPTSSQCNCHCGSK